jgi:hypothetical protein
MLRILFGSLAIKLDSLQKLKDEMNKVIDDVKKVNEENELLKKEKIELVEINCLLHEQLHDYLNDGKIQEKLLLDIKDQLNKYSSK